jgi:DNA repair protein RadD
MATGFNAWGGVFFLNGRWHAVGGGKDLRARLLAVGERTVCMAKADDWLNDHESQDSAHKTRRWLNEPPTEKQLRYLPEQMPPGLWPDPLPGLGAALVPVQQGTIQRLVMAANDGPGDAREAA